MIGDDTHTNVRSVRPTPRLRCSSEAKRVSAVLRWRYCVSTAHDGAVDGTVHD
jgi:hypothetical protein